jgi:hypothetical protein
MAPATTAFVPTTADRDTLADALQAALPYASVERSTLGGEHRASLQVTVSLDPRDQWSYGILHNSRYAMFSINGGKVEQFSRHHQTAKFRKANANSVEEAISRIMAWKDKN